MREPDSMTLAALAVAGAVTTMMAAACGAAEPRSDADRLSRGREIIERMSATLGSTRAFTVTTVEVRDEVRSNGGTEHVTVTRETTVRRPDRLYSTVSGDRDSELWYDGVGLTLVLHDDKIFGQARAPETLDKTLDAVHERFGVSVPLADFVYSSPAKALLTETTAGGWMSRATVDGETSDHLSFQSEGVRWQVWIPVAGDPLPRRVVAEFTHDKRLRKIETTFKNWNLTPPIREDRFSPTVPPDYEGVAILQRASILRNMSRDDDTGASNVTGVGK